MWRYANEGWMEVGYVCECEERDNMGVRRFVKKLKGVITVLFFLLTEVEVFFYR